MATSPATQEKVLSDDQVAFYQRHGYLILKNVLSASELQELQAASGRLRDERARLAGDDRLAVIQNVALFDDAFMMAAKHPVMLGAVTQLIGENLRLQHCKLNWKPPAKGKGEVGWHQDFPFFPHTNYDLLACMFLLDDAVCAWTTTNGCMRMIPGSHLRGPRLRHAAAGALVYQIAAGHCTKCGRSGFRAKTHCRPDRQPHGDRLSADHKRSPVALHRTARVSRGRRMARGNIVDLRSCCTGRPLNDGIGAPLLHSAWSPPEDP